MKSDLAPPSSDPPRESWSRRDFLQNTAAAAAGVGIAAAGTTCAPVQAAPSAVTGAGAALVETSLTINGAKTSLVLQPRQTLLDVLREQLHFTGTKKGCDHGQCGSCTVLVDGRRINACLTLAVTLDGADVTTVEGLAKGDELHPVQQAFIDHDGFQCGYCTSGQICSAVALLKENHAGSDEEIREWMSGNLCRCGAYPNIVAAIRDAKTKMPASA